MHSCSFLSHTHKHTSRARSICITYAMLLHSVCIFLTFFCSFSRSFFSSIGWFWLFVLFLTLFYLSSFSFLLLRIFLLFTPSLRFRSISQLFTSNAWNEFFPLCTRREIHRNRSQTHTQTRSFIRSFAWSSVFNLWISPIRTHISHSTNIRNVRIKHLAYYISISTFGLKQLK